jgi:hypothetical protein
MRKKADLPQKTCATCARPFAWRAKWRRDWDAVRYCSDRCRDGRSSKNEPRDRTATDR